MTASDTPGTPLKTRLARRAFGNAYVILTVTALMWAGNALASRIATGEVSPMVLTMLRWVLVCAILAVVARRAVAAQWRLLLPRWWQVALMGTVGYTAFNAFFYAAGNYTTVLNLTLFQGALPVIVLVGTFLVHGTTITPLQGVGVAVTLAGVVLASTHGDLSVLRSFAFNIGDLYMLIACVFYAGYTVALPSRPKVSGLVFFTAMAAAALVTSLPLVAVEIARGTAIWPTTPTGFAVLAYVGIFPSLISQLLFMRGVEMIGPNRAGIFMNLVPILGPMLGVVFLGERFGATEAGAVALVLGGIYIAERLGRRPTIVD